MTLEFISSDDSRCTIGVKGETSAPTFYVAMAAMRFSLFLSSGRTLLILGLEHGGTSHQPHYRFRSPSTGSAAPSAGHQHLLGGERMSVPRTCGESTGP